MSSTLILASGSQTRAGLLRQARLDLATEEPRVDEVALRDAMLSEGAAPRDIADALAEMKARRVSVRHPGALVIGADQVLVLGSRVLAKPADMAEARTQLQALRGQTHQLLSAAVVCQAGAPLWRHVGTARLTMRDFSDDWLDGYLSRNPEAATASVGAYRIEEEGIRLFSAIEGDYFTILGLPLLPLLSWLTIRGSIPS